MAINVGSAVTAFGADPNTSVTVPGVTTSGSDRVLFAAAAWKNWGVTCSSVVRGGTENFTEVYQSESAAVTHIGIWRLIAPATSSASVVFTFSAAIEDAAGIVIPLDGVHQTTPFGTEGHASDLTGTSAAPTVTVSAASDEVLLDLVTGSTYQITVGADQTEKANLYNSPGPGSLITGSSSQLGSADDTMSWSLVSAANWYIVAVPIKPAAGGALSPWVTVTM
jgi:hypothetical protein